MRLVAKSARTDGAPLAFGGLWEGWRSAEGETLRTFTIVATEANGDMSVLHDRMPVILEAAAWPVWLGEAPGTPAGGPATAGGGRCSAALAGKPRGEQHAEQRGGLAWPD